MRSHKGGRYVYRYLFRQTDDLKIKHFAALEQEWLEFIKENRTKGGIQHSYDVVMGPVTDDNTMETVQLYLSGILKAEEAVERLRYSKVNNQFSSQSRLYGICMDIVYTFQAQQDLKNIYEYIAYSLLVPDTARSMYQQIIQSVRSLESMPERNPLYKEEPWRSQGVRFVPVKNYLLFYTVNNETHTVSIARILYGGMDINHQLEETIEF